MISSSRASNTCFPGNEIFCQSEKNPILNIIMLISDIPEPLSSYKMLLSARGKILFGMGIPTRGIKNQLFRNEKAFSADG